MKDQFAIISIVVLVGFALLVFWPKGNELPNQGTVEDPALSTLDEEEFILSDSKPKLIAFFYTQCPDVCPMTIQNLKHLQDALDDKGVTESDYQVLLITLDPEFDTVERIKQYKKNFDITASNWYFLRGSIQKTKQFADQFNLVYKKNSDGYVTHRTTMYLIDENNHIRSDHDMASPEKSVNLNQLAANIQTLLH